MPWLKSFWTDIGQKWQLNRVAYTKKSAVFQIEVSLLRKGF